MKRDRNKHSVRPVRQRDIQARGCAFERTGSSLRAAGLALFVLLLVPSSALARQARLFSGSFGSSSSTVVDPYPLAEPTSVAVDDASHDVYVTDPGNHRVEKFDSSGNFLMAFGAEVGGPGVNVCGGVVVCSPGTSGTAPAAFEGPNLYVAVDNSSGPSAGDVYVAEDGTGKNLVQNFGTIGATGGSFRLTFEGQTTGPIALGSSALQLKQKLEALSTIGAGNVEVLETIPTKGALPSYRVEFEGALAKTSLKQMTFDSSGLLPAGSGIGYVGPEFGAPGSSTVVTKFDSSGNVISSWGNGGQLDGSTVTSPPAPAPGPFGQLSGIAVDTAGNLWVAGAGLYNNQGQFVPRMRVFEFKQDATLITDSTFTESALVSSGISLDSEDNIYLTSEHSTFKFNSTGLVGLISEAQGGSDPRAFDASSIVADPSNANLYVGVEGLPNEFTKGQTGIVRYDGSCHPMISAGSSDEPCVPVESFGIGLFSEGSDEPAALAVDSTSPSNPVYAAQREVGDVLSFAVETVPDVMTVPASNLTPAAVTLNGTVSPDGVALKEGPEGCRFEWGETMAYGHVAACSESAVQIGTGSSPVEVHAEISGLKSGATYHFRLYAANEHGSEVGRDVVFGAPSIESEAVLDVSSTSASVQGQVDPQNADTKVRFEYGTTANYGQVSTEVDLGNGGETQTPRVHLQGLLSATVYHYRVVATNILGVSEGADRSFTTQAAGSAFVLPDGRQWEMVSPVEKHGSVLIPIANSDVLQSSLSGEAFAYVGTVPTEAGTQGYVEYSQLIADRVGGGWRSRDIQLPNPAATGPSVGEGADYRFASEDLSSEVVAGSPYTTEVFPPVSEDTPYVRREATCAVTPATCYTPLLTGVEGYANVPPGTKFGKAALQFVGASPDGAHVIVTAGVALTDPLVTGEKTKGGLYEWSANAAQGELLKPVSVLPAGEMESGAQLGGENVARHTVSEDGSRVIWSAKGHLYLRDVTREKTVQLDTVQTGASGSGEMLARFQDASGDGSRIFFTDRQQLTADSSSSSFDLYECAIVETDGELGCELFDLTPTPTAGGIADVQGTIMGVSNDGSWAYFVANGAYGNGVSPGDCKEGSSTSSLAVECDLYVSHFDGTSWETPRLVAALSGHDFSDWSGNGRNLADLTARVSSGGRYLAFMSARSLTGYDNADANTGKPDEEVYLYDAEGGEGAGRLVCASCNPTGARPTGVTRPAYEHGLIDVYAEDGQGVAGNIPGWTGGAGLYQSRYLSDEGRLFFNSSDALVPQDINNNEDVYEYEPGGVGNCTSALSTFVELENGCVSLISSGTATGESGFLDASASGDDVFFLTGEKLAAQDVDAALDVYDAHVCSTVAPCVSTPPPPPPCTTADACRTAASPQPAIFGSPASATFTGNGNVGITVASGSATPPKVTSHARLLARALAVCRRDKRKRKRGLCERRALAKYGASSARKGKTTTKGKG